MTAKRKVSNKSLQWIQAGQNRTDRERAERAGERVRRYFDVCELLRNEARWWTVAEIDERFQMGPRLIRRTLDHLAAAALVELERGRYGSPTRARFQLTKLQAKKIR